MSTVLFDLHSPLTSCNIGKFAMMLRAMVLNDNTSGSRNHPTSGRREGSGLQEMIVCYRMCYSDMRIPIPKTLVIWASPETLTWGCPYHCGTRKISRKLSVSDLVARIINSRDRLLPPQGFHPEGEIPRRHSSNSRVY